MAYLPLHSAGTEVKWAVETTAGTRPESGYTTLHGVKEIAPYNDAPNTLQTTDLSAWPNHTFTRGLNSGNGVLSITVNDYKTFRDDYTAMYSAWETAAAAGKSLWIEYAYPDDSSMESYFYSAEPSPLGFGGASVDAVLENVAYFIQTGQPIFATASA
jgi:hypothetical protein